MMKNKKQAINEFGNYLKSEEKAPSTVEKYIRDVSAFMSWCEGNELTKWQVLKYKQELIENYAPASVNSIISSLNSFFAYCELNHLKIKSLKIQKQIFASRNKELTKAEYERLLYAAKQRKNKRLYYVLQTVCSTGIRISEDI